MRRPWYTNGWVLLAGILVVAACLRLVYLREIVGQPTFTHAIYDPQYNDYWARALVTGDWTVPDGVNCPEIPTTPHGRPPGYPYFLAAVYWAFGLSYLAPRLVQMALGLVNCVLMFLLGRALFGRAVGLVAAAFMAAYWVFIYFEGVLTYPAVAVFLLLCLMHALRFWMARPTFWRALLGGLFLGAFGLFRPNGLLYLPVVIFWMGWVLHRMGRWPILRYRLDRGFRRSVLSVLGLGLGALLALTPTTVRNYVVARDFVFVSSYGGLNLYVGNNPEASCVEPRIPGLKELAGIDNWCCFDYPMIVRGLARKLDRDRLKFSEANTYFYKKASEFMLHSPWLCLKKTVKKALLFWGPAEVTNDTVMAYDKEYSPLLRHMPGFPWVVALFVTGALLFFYEACVRGRPDKRRLETQGNGFPIAIAVLLFVVSYFASVLPFFIAGRYRVPIIPFLLLFAAYGLVRIARYVAAGAYREAAGWFLAAVAVFVLANWNVAGYEPSRATWHVRCALAYEAAGEIDGAIAEYRKAAEMENAPSIVYNNLAQLLVRQGEVEEALDTFKEGLKINPEDAAIHNNLGYELAKLGRPDEAISHYEAAVADNPGLAAAHTNLGRALLDQGKLAEAMGHYTQAAAIPSRDGHNNVGYAFAGLGLWDLAEAQYRNALEIDPYFVLARINLGNAFLAQEKLDEAARQYVRVAEIDPDSRHAQYNLGVVADRSGNPDKAIEYYRRALKLDPAYPEAHNNLGYILQDRGKLEAAISHYRAAVDANPRFSRAYVNLADALAASGNPDEAARCYERALVLNPDDEYSRQRLERIRSAGTKGDGDAF